MGIQHKMIEAADISLKDQFLGAMGRAVCMVNVVTTDGPAGRFGATVSAMSSVSAEMSPPTLLICINQGGVTAPALVRNGVFCLNILREAQQGVADCFAGRVKTASGDKFDCANWSRNPTGAWRLDDALASFDCRVLKADLIGTHYVIIGSAEAVSFRADAAALLYGDRDYRAAVTLSDLFPV